MKRMHFVIFLSLFACLTIAAAETRVVLAKLEPPTLTPNNTRAIALDERATFTVQDGTNAVGLVEHYKVTVRYSTNAFIDPTSRVPVWYASTERQVTHTTLENQVMWVDQPPFDMDWEAKTVETYGPPYKPGPLPNIMVTSPEPYVPGVGFVGWDYFRPHYRYGWSSPWRYGWGYGRGYYGGGVYYDGYGGIWRPSSTTTVRVDAGFGLHSGGFVDGRYHRVYQTAKRRHRG